MAEFWREFVKALSSSDQYKPGKGNLLRYGTLAGILGLAGFGLSSLNTILSSNGQAVSVGVPLLLLLGIGWVAWRLINLPMFAEFLISTNIEIEKVTWPNRKDLRVSTIVVLLNVLIFSVFLFTADFLWQGLLHAAGILRFWVGAFDSPNQ
jgi:preprotein translocase subunit SecE